MKRAMILSVCLALLAAGGPVRAADFAGTIVAELQQQGYGRIATDVTWLGRVRIVAEREGGTREIILNPRTGEILRDMWLLAEGGSGDEGSRLIGDDDDGDDNDESSGSGSDDSSSGSDDSSSGSGSGGSDDSSSGSGSGGSDDSSSGSGSSGSNDG